MPGVQAQKTTIGGREAKQPVNKISTDKYAAFNADDHDAPAGMEVGALSMIFGEQEDLV